MRKQRPVEEWITVARVPARLPLEPRPPPELPPHKDPEWQQALQAANSITDVPSLSQAHTEFMACFETEVLNVTGIDKQPERQRPHRFVKQQPFAKFNGRPLSNDTCRIWRSLQLRLQRAATYIEEGMFAQARWLVTA